MEQSLDIDRNEDGVWIDLDHGGSELVSRIGTSIEYEVNETINTAI